MEFLSAHRVGGCSCSSVSATTATDSFLQGEGNTVSEALADAFTTCPDEMAALCAERSSIFGSCSLVLTTLHSGTLVGERWG